MVVIRSILPESGRNVDNAWGWDLAGEGFDELDEVGGFGGVDGAAGVGGFFEAGADDKAVGVGGEFSDGGEGGTGADEDRGMIAGGGFDGGEFAGVGRLAGAGAGDDECVRKAAVDDIFHFHLNGPRSAQRCGVFDINIGEDFDGLRAELFAEAEQVMGDSLQDALIGHARGTQDVHTDVARSAGVGDGQRAQAIVAEDVDA